MKYIAKATTWLSHECRLVQAGQEFETEFPKGPGGKDMRLGDNIAEVKPAKAEKQTSKESDSLV